MKHFAGRAMAYKRIDFKVVVGGKTFRFSFKAKDGCGYTEKEIEIQRGRVIDYIDEKFPTLEFREVQLLANVFNFIAIGVREKVNEEKSQIRQETHPETAGAGAEQGGEFAGGHGETADTAGCSSPLVRES
jgi:hypothetical protein